jgi:WD40 repeat protein
MSCIFISHSAANNAEAIALCDWMESYGWDDIFLDLDPERGLKAGERWQEGIRQAAQRCELVICLISPDWANSKWCLAEFLLAKTLNKRIFAAVIQPTPFEIMPIEMVSEWQIIDLTAGRRDTSFNITLPPDNKLAEVAFSSDGLKRLLIGLEKAGVDARYFPWPPAHDPLRSPYRGLRPMEADDAGIFFGREAALIETIDCLRGQAMTALPRLTVILGASGAGKSSFLRAGVLPRLGREPHVFLPLPALRPGRAPISGETGLINVLTEAFRTSPLKISRHRIREAVRGGASQLTPMLTKLRATAQFSAIETAPSKLPILVLAIDQGEELFSAEAQDEAQAFLMLLRNLVVSDELPISVMLTIRSDSYDRLQTAPALDGLNQATLSLLPIPKASFVEIVKKPIDRLKSTSRAVKLDDELVDALLADIAADGAKDALPLLAFTLERLYAEYGAGGHLGLNQYVDLGRIKGSIEAAVEHVLKVADDDARIAPDKGTRFTHLRRGLIPWLASVDPETRTPRRRVACLAEIPTEARPMIDLLVEQRLLSTDVSNDTGETIIELAHEALLRQWGPLQEWLEEDLESLVCIESVKRASRDWIANGRSDEYLAHRGGRLESAEQALSREDLARIVQCAELDYLRECRDRQEIERLAKEREQNAIRAASQQYKGRLAEIAKNELAQGDAVTALLVSLEESDIDRSSTELSEVATLATSTMRELYVIPQHVTSSISISEDCTKICCFSKRGDEVFATLFSAASGGLIWSVPLTEFGVGRRHFESAISPDGLYIVVASNSGNIIMLSAKDGAQLRRFEGKAYSCPPCLAWMPNGKCFSHRGYDAIEIFDWQTGGSVQIPVRREMGEHWIRSWGFICDGKRFFEASKFNGFAVYDVPSKKCILWWKFAVNAVVNRDNRGEFIIANGSSLRLVSLRRRLVSFGVAASAPYLWDSPGGDITAFDYSADGKTAAVALEGGLGIVFDTSNGKKLAATQFDAATISDLCISGDGRVVSALGIRDDVLYGEDRPLFVWYRESNNVEVVRGHVGKVKQALFSPNKSFWITTAEDGTIRRWNIDYSGYRYVKLPPAKPGSDDASVALSYSKMYASWNSGSIALQLDGSRICVISISTLRIDAYQLPADLEYDGIVFLEEDEKKPCVVIKKHIGSADLPIDIPGVQVGCGLDFTETGAVQTNVKGSPVVIWTPTLHSEALPHWMLQTDSEFGTHRMRLFSKKEGWIDVELYGDTLTLRNKFKAVVADQFDRGNFDYVFADPENNVFGSYEAIWRILTLFDISTGRRVFETTLPYVGRDSSVDYVEAGKLVIAGEIRYVVFDLASRKIVRSSKRRGANWREQRKCMASRNGSLLIGLDSHRTLTIEMLSQDGEHSQNDLRERVPRLLTRWQREVLGLSVEEPDWYQTLDKWPRCAQK